MACPESLSGTSRISRQRLRRRLSVWQDVNETIDALNGLYGCSDPFKASSGHTTDANPAQRSVLSRVTSLISRRRPRTVQQPKPAARQLLGTRLDYVGDGTTVEPYDALRVSLPEGQSSPIPWEIAVPAALRDQLHLDNILADDDVVEHRQLYDNPSLYTDVHIENNPEVRKEFYKRLFRCGILGATKNRRGSISPFFVRKKGGKQRLVLDCRRVNMFFRRPPKPEMGTAETLQRMENPNGGPVYIAEADIQNCFYQCGMHTALCEFFCFEGEHDPVFLRELGISRDLDGDFLCEDDHYSLCLLALPMGFSWSFWVIQELHHSALAEAGFGPDRCVVGSWPVPDLAAGSVALPYCDNLNLFGFDPVLLNSQLQAVMGVLSAKGFALHEVVWATQSSTPLGSYFDGANNEIGSKPERAWQIKSALKWFAKGPRVTGRQVEALIGHYTHEGLFARGSLSVFRAAYTFVQDSYYVRQELWPSVCREMYIAAGLMPLMVSRLDLPWSPYVTATDACESGWGACKAFIGSDKAREHGMWTERWRFKRLLPDEWAPRQRALREPDSQHLDVFADPRTVGLAESDEVPVPSEQKWKAYEGFPELGNVPEWDWHVTRSGRFRYDENICVKELRSLVWDFEKQLRDPAEHNRKHLRLLDNFGGTLALSRGRAGDFGVLQMCRRFAALALACNVVSCLRWVASELNPSDEPSRRFEECAASRAALYAARTSGGAGPTSRAATCLYRHNQKVWRDAASQLLYATHPAQNKQTTSKQYFKKPLKKQGYVHSQTQVRDHSHAANHFRYGEACQEGTLDTWGNQFGDSPCSGAVSQICPRVPTVAVRSGSGQRPLTSGPRPGRSLRQPICSRSAGKPGRKGDSSRILCEQASNSASYSCSADTQGLSTPAGWEVKTPFTGLPRGRHLCSGYASGKNIHGSGDSGGNQLLSQAGGDRCIAGGGPSCPSEFNPGRSANVEYYNSRPGCGTPQQNGDSGRHSCSDTPFVARPPYGLVEVQQKSRTASIQSHHGTAIAGLEGDLSGFAYTRSRLSASPFGSGVRSAGEETHGSKLDGPWKVEDIDLSETLRKVKFDKESAFSATSSPASVLRVQPAESAGHHVRHNASADTPLHVSPGCEHRALKHLQETHQCGGRRATRLHGFIHHTRKPPSTRSPEFVEWCSGTSRLSTAAAEAGIVSESFEVTRSYLENVLSRWVKKRMRALINQGNLKMVRIGIPCGSFTRARRNDPNGRGWPPPLRGDSESQIYGLPNLSEKDERRVIDGNRLASEMCDLVKLCIKRKVPVVVENPQSSRLWLWPELQPLLSRASSNIVLHQCQFNSSFRKATRLVAWNIDITALEKRCKPKQNLCSASGKPHQVLEGRKGKEGFWTSIASAYPPALCTSIVGLL